MSRYFPLFVNLEGKQIFVYGAGTIATRRMESLLEFGCEITVISPEVSQEVAVWAEQGKFSLRKERYFQGQIPEDVFLVLAATNDADVNRTIAKECKNRQIPVNVCSEKELCDFYFPGLAIKEDVVVGITAGGANHRLAREVTEKVRKYLDILV